jgi:L-alanine-DL-glutamate epimerase-like enolase superfamily enzyme
MRFNEGVDEHGRLNRKDKPISSHPVISFVALDDLKVSAYAIPTMEEESDGTFKWKKTIMVLTEISAGGMKGIGYSYADLATATLIKEIFIPLLKGRNAFDIPACWNSMVDSIRNLGRPGIASMAISAVDNALWDLKANLLNMPLVSLLGSAHEKLPLYWSGGFTSYSIDQLKKEFSHWAERGLTRFKMKIGREPQADIERVKAARTIIGKDAGLFVDANGAYSRKQALKQAYIFEELNVNWFEEPVSSDDLQGLHLIRDQAPPGMNIAAGEYGYELDYFRRMLDYSSVDILQADVTRCSGITGLLQVAALCGTFHVPLSFHCAPAMHLHPGCAIGPMVHSEYFHDHVIIEKIFFEGVAEPVNGCLYPNLSIPGNGLLLKRNDVKKFLL